MLRLRHQNQNGQALVEFVFVAVILVTLLGGILHLGEMFLLQGAIQDAARLAARELSLAPLPADIKFDDALKSDFVRERIFDPNRLVFDLSTFSEAAEVEQHFATLPVVNQALRPVMRAQKVSSPEGERVLLRYPGTLIMDMALQGQAHNPKGYAVRLKTSAQERASSKQFISILQELRTNPSDASTGSFSLLSRGSQKGMVAVQLSCPYYSVILGGDRLLTGQAFFRREVFR